MTIDGTLQALGGSAAMNLPGPDVTVTEAMGALVGGRNLFHSFGRFNVPTGGSVTFTGTTPNIANVLGRVTGIGRPEGLTASMIDGVLRSTIPNANLFLMNPAGIMFGPGASLDIGQSIAAPGSFHAITADVIRFADGGMFTAAPVAGESFSAADVTAFGFTTGNPNPIDISQSLLEVGVGQTVSIVAGEDPTLLTVDPGVRISGGGAIVAPGGRVNLVSVGSSGVVGLEEPDLGSFAQGGRVLIEQGSAVDVSDGGGGGTVVVRGGELVINNSLMFADTLGDADGATVGIDIVVLDDLILENGSFVTADMLGTGDAGDIQLAGSNIEIRSGAIVSSRGFFGATGTPGDIDVKANSLLVTGGSAIFSGIGDFGNVPGGHISISGSTINLLNGSVLGVSGTGGGAVTILGDTFVMDGGAAIFANTLAALPGTAPAIYLEFAGDLVIANDSTLEAATLGVGDAGGALLSAGQDVVMVLSTLFTGSTDGGAGGDVQIAAGRDLQFISNLIDASSSGFGRSGDVLVITGRDAVFVPLSEGFIAGAVDTSSVGGDRAGDVTVIASNDVVIDALVMDLSGGSFSLRGGDLGVLAGRNMQIDNSSVDTSSSSGFGALTGGFFGRAGGVFLDAGRDASFFLTDFDTSTIDGSAGPSGAVISRAGEDLLFRFSTIDSSTDSPFQGGDVDFAANGNAVFEFALIETGSDAVLGRGGDIFMSAIDLTLESSLILTSSVSDRSGTVSFNADTYAQIGAGQIDTIMFGSGRAGDINIVATTSVEMRGQSAELPLLLDVSVTQQEGLPVPTGDAGAISIIAPLMTLDNAQLLANTGGVGQGGIITIAGERFVAQNQTFLTSASLGSGPGGSVSIDTEEAIEFIGGSRIEASSSGDGDAASVLLRSGTVLLSDGVLISANVDGNGAGGSITIDSDRFTLGRGSGITSLTTGIGPMAGRGGDISIVARESLEISRGDVEADTGIFSSTIGDGDAGDISFTSPMVLLDGGFAAAFSADEENPNNTGNAGDISFDVGELILRNGAAVSAGTGVDTVAGQGGSVVVHATERVLLDGSTGRGASILNGVGGTSLGGPVMIDAPLLTIQGGAFIETQALGDGRGGDITITVANLELFSGGALSSSSAAGGAGGTLTVNASESVDIVGATPEGNRSGLASGATSSGNAGIVEVTTPLLTMDGGIITARTQDGGSGNAGAIILNVGTLNLQGGALITSNSQTGATGAAGSVRIRGLASTAESITLTNSSVVTTADAAAGGSISMDATDISLINSTVSAAVLGGDDADLPPANVTLTAGENLRVTESSAVSARSDGQVDAGNVSLRSGGDLLIGTSTVETEASLASGGNIKLTAPNLIFVSDSTVSASVQGSEVTAGGDITFDPRFVIIRNSDIIAQAVQGAGGNILITGDVVLIDADSVVDASSQFGVSGEVRIDSPIQNLSQALAPLPQDFIKIATLFAARCVAEKGGAFSSFVQAGRDGVPPAPPNLLESPLIDDADVAAPAATGASRLDPWLPAAGEGPAFAPATYTLVLSEMGCGP